MDPLLTSLGRIRRRLLALRTVEAGLIGAMGAAPPAALFTLIRILMPQHVPQTAAWPALPLALLPSGFLVGMAWQLVRGVSMHEAAMAADRAAGLQERLTTAVETLSPRAGGALRAGLLDKHLLEQARAAAAAVEPCRLHLTRTMPRTARVVAVAALLLTAATLVPSVGGPPVPPRVAQKAADALRQVATKDTLAPAIRAWMDNAAKVLAEPGVRQAEADRATAGILESMSRQAAARRDIAAALSATENPDLKDIMKKVEQGDLDGARKAAERLGMKLRGVAGRGRSAAGRPTEGGRRPLGAAPLARQEDLPRLAAELERAAEAIRRSQPDLTKTLQELASQMTESLRPPSAEDVAVVSQVRTAIGSAPPPAVTGTTAALPAVAPTATGPAAVEAALSPAIHPEDRQVVRQYFGGREP